MIVLGVIDGKERDNSNEQKREGDACGNGACEKRGT